MSEAMEEFIKIDIQDYLKSQNIDLSDKEFDKLLNTMLQDEWMWQIWNQRVAEHVHDILVEKERDE